MTNEDKKLISEVVETLTTVIEDKTDCYKHVVTMGDKQQTMIVNREQHLESMIEWAIDTIVGNIELEETER